LHMTDSTAPVADSRRPIERVQRSRASVASASAGARRVNGSRSCSRVNGRPHSP
jgi:hypothetical protein